MFRKAFRNQRCVIPLDWWIEWYRTNSGKQPYAIRPADVATERHEKAPFFLAGLWNKAPEIEGFEGSGEVTYTILTQKPHPDIAGVHDRQPVALTIDDVNAWLDEEVGNDELRALIERRGFERYDFWAISKRVGSVAHQDSSLIDPISQ